MSDVVARLNAALRGRYRIDRELGQGGMATVYLADDLRHEREVAVKVLRPELAAVLGAERFLGEIKTTAKLQHPHILPLFDSGEADGFLYYVMPYVPGESLRDRLDRERQLAVADAVRLTRKLADALDYAHGRGVVHRDIKPGNILLSERGEPLVADFGIALAVAQAGSGRLTETGLSLGTPNYMSPEQASGDRDVDSRSDVYALACVLYEMLAGAPPFSASTAQAMLAKILTMDAPPVTAARRTVPAHVEAALARALEKLPADRFAGAAEFGVALGDESFRYRTPAGSVTPTDDGGPAAAEAPAPRSGSWLADPRSIAALAAVVLVAVWGALRGADTGSEATAPVSFRFPLTDTDFRVPLGSSNHLAISPDGSQIALTAPRDGASRLFVRAADQPGFEEVRGTEGAGDPGFSPDGRWLVFTLGGQVRRMEVSGGPILPVVEGLYPQWGREDEIVFQAPGGIALVAPSGGSPTLILPDAGANSRPHLLPDGKAVVFQSGGTASSARLSLVEIGSGEVVDLGIDGANPQYAAGYLLFGDEDQALEAVPFDLESHRVSGEPAIVLPDVLVYSGGATQFAVSQNGTAVYARSRGTGQSASELVIVDLQGDASVSPLGPGTYSTPRFSPDGRLIAYAAGGGVWVWNRDSGANARLGTDAIDPVWSRDGRSIYFGSHAGASVGYDLFRMNADGSGERERLLRRPGIQVPLSESADASRLLVLDAAPAYGVDLRIATLSPDTTVFSDYLVAPWTEGFGEISPDGTRVAYMSEETGAAEVYLRSFPDAGRQIRVSENGGAAPLWAPDGASVYYLNRGQVWRADLIAGGVGERKMLFQGNWAPSTAGGPVANWDIAPDGRSFVLVRNPADSSEGGPPPFQLEVVVNWFDELRQRVGG